MTINLGKCVLALIALSLSTTAIAADAAERLTSSPLPGFVVGYEASNGTQAIREEVPKGETVEAWTRMVTTQRFAGLPPTVTPAAFLAPMATNAARSCPGAQATTVTSLTIAGRAAARMQVDCPSSAGGVPESFVILAIAGDAELHVKQAAVRGPGAPGKLGWGETLLAATRLCTSGDKAPACR